MSNKENSKPSKFRYQMGKRSPGWKKTIQFKKPEQSTDEKKDQKS